MTQTQQRLIGVLLLVVVLAGSWMLLLSPALEDRQTARDELAQAQSAEAAAQASRQTAERAVARLPENRRVIAELARVVPEQAESAALLDRLNGLARRSGVRFDSLELAGTGDAAAGGGGSANAGRGGAASAGAASPGAEAQQVPVTLQVRGTYPRVVALLRRLHGRGATLGGGRLLRLDAVGVAVDDDEAAPPGRLVIDITAVAFVLPPVGEDAAATGTPAPTSGTGPAEPAATANVPGGTG